MTLEEVQQGIYTTVVAYMNERTKEYEEYGLKSVELFENWKADNESFAAAPYNKTTQGTRILRHVLRINGVYIAENRKSIADHLISRSKVWTPWSFGSNVSSGRPSHKSLSVKHQSVSTAQLARAPPSVENAECKPDGYDYQADNSSQYRPTTARGTIGKLINLPKIYSQDHEYS